MRIINQLLQIQNKDIEEVRKMYNKSEEDAKNDVKILKMWMEQQPHLPQNYDENRLERMLMRNKFRIEQCKSKIDSYFTLRGMYSNFFQNINSTLGGFDNIRKSVIYVPMPQLTEKKERICIMQYNPEFADLYNLQDQFGYILALMDLEFSHDYAAATMFIVDFKGLTMTVVKKVDMNQLSKAMALYQTAYSERISKVHWINAPAFVDILAAMLKATIKPKLFSKIKISKTLPEFHASIDKRYLPLDYGGEQRSVREIHEQMGEMWKEEIDFLSRNAKKVSNEKLRIGEPYKNDLFGTEGTFKKLNLD